MAKMSTKQILGIILIVSAAIHYLPVVDRLAWLGVLATFIVGLYLLIK
ncbi:MAG: hypothetical protein KKD17_05690 [Nanoarchaeota archaeon]|nr:hypothetical protein [Nanoarchaeota archaeon]